METPNAFIGNSAEAELADTAVESVETDETPTASTELAALPDAGPAALETTPDSVDTHVAPEDEDEDEDDDEDDEDDEDEGPVLDPDLLLRLSLLVDTLFDEMRRSEDLSDPAVGRARNTVKTVVAKIPEAVSVRLAEEAALLFAELGDDADAAEVRIALSHVVGWFNGIFQSLKMISPDQLRAALQAGMSAQASGPPPGMPMPQASAAPGYI